jgi:hypothetical protein
VDAKYKKPLVLTRFRPKDKKIKKSREIGKNGSANVKCLYVKTSKSDVDKKTIKNGKRILSKNLLNFVIDSDEVKEKHFRFILYKEIDILTMVKL